MDQQKTISIFTDGGSRGNPGPSALGVYIEQNGKPLAEIGKRIGNTTNNFAEYSAILEALSWVEENKSKLDFTKIDFFMDSELAYSQLIGIYKIKNEGIRKFIFEIREKEVIIGVPIVYSHVRREKNTKADKLVNLALDNLI